ncbi:MAG: 3-phosphoshikimate 1-carboxyvinyltransferase [Candidatus Melainabacteria bacterium]|nr:3-phosphoshikimate 1-carboxyvinyltransferase [Candidatus Melainabacteria bacterium]
MVLLRGTLAPPGDKSMTHRAIIFAALVKGRVEIDGALLSGDTKASALSLRKLGLSMTIEPEERGAHIAIVSPGILEIRRNFAAAAPACLFDCGNSGTTMRLLAGLCAGLQGGTFVFDGDASLRRRDMKRILAPLSELGAGFRYLGAEGCAPFELRGERLQGGDFNLTVSSAQVVTALILAALSADAPLTVSTPYVVRDHTLRALRFMGVDISCPSPGKNALMVRPLTFDLAPCRFSIPGDISSCAFFLVAAAILPGSAVTLLNVGVNPGRTLVIDVLRRMGVQIDYLNEREVCGEPVCDLFVQAPAALTATDISAEEVPSGIDEIPALSLAFAFAAGRSTVRGAGELKQKESNRLKLLTDNLLAAGVAVEVYDDGFAVQGKGYLAGGSFWRTDLDHRLAMIGMVASLAAREPLMLEEKESCAVSYPQFEADLKSLLV